MRKELHACSFEGLLRIKKSSAVSSRGPGKGEGLPVRQGKRVSSRNERGGKIDEKAAFVWKKSRFPVAEYILAGNQGGF